MNKRLLIIVVYCVVGLLYCKAQSLSSIEEQYSSLQCLDTIVVRINATDNNSTIISCNDDMYGLPSFVYHSHSGTGVSKRFPWPIIANFYGGIFYKVNDMITLDGRCYFCGRKHAPIGNEYTMDGHVVLIYQTTGFFGWFTYGRNKGVGGCGTWANQRAQAGLSNRIWCQLGLPCTGCGH